TLTASLRSPASVNSTIVTIFGAPAGNGSAAVGSGFRNCHSANPASPTPAAARKALRPVARRELFSSFSIPNITSSSRKILSKRERESLYAGVQELDFERAIFHFTLLTDQLIKPIVGYRTIAAAVRVRSVVVSRRRSIQ